ncbi:MAG: Phosphoglycerate dehydrogenase [Clostridiales bacterium]|nr:Phosphoglycerate dehydrogenase [Clostridiales bacterium]
MYKAVVVDKDYGSVSLENLLYIKSEYEKNGIELALFHCANEDEIIDACKDADAILGTGNPPISRKVLSSLPKLKVVQRFGIGVNSVDLEAASEYGKLIMFMPGFCIEELATHAASFILSLIRNTAYYDRKIRKGLWPKATYYVPKSVNELTLGLFGFGGAAKPLYEIFKNGFKTRVIACDPYVQDSVKSQYDVEFVDFDELLKQSDIISIQAPLTKDTHHIFNEDAFKKMKNDSMIVNIARGEIIKQDDLIKALKEGEIRFAGLDVFEKEPLEKDNPLLEMDNVILTCHSAFYGEKAQKNQLQLSIELVDGILNNKTVKKNYVANKAVIDKTKEYIYV